MPPTPPNSTPVTAPAGSQAAPAHRQWQTVTRRANTRAKVITFLVALVLAGSGIGFLVSRLFTPAKSNQPSQTTVQNLSTEDVQKLGQLGSQLGSRGQILTVGADSVFKTNVNIGGDLSLSGKLNANGPVTLTNINAGGNSNFGGVTIGQGLQVGGAATVQGGLNAQSFLNVNGTLNVNGASSLGTVTASSLTVHNLSVLGPLSVTHLVSNGPTPSIARGGSLGGAGTANMSGNDTAGRINLNTGGGTSGGLLATITFRSSYGNRPHVILMPATSAAATTPVYVQVSATGFSIVASQAPPTGQTLTFDYIVVQ